MWQVPQGTLVTNCSILILMPRLLGKWTWQYDQTNQLANGEFHYHTIHTIRNNRLMLVILAWLTIMRFSILMYWLLIELPTDWIDVPMFSSCHRRLRTVTDDLMEPLRSWAYSNPTRRAARWQQLLLLILRWDPFMGRKLVDLLYLVVETEGSEAASSPGWLNAPEIHPKIVEFRSCHPATL